MKKRIISVLLISMFTVLGLAFLVGCAKDDSYRVDIFSYGEDEFADVMIGKLEKILRDDYKFKVQVHNADWSSDKQEEQFNSVLQRGTDLMMMGTANYPDADKFSQAAKEKGVQVIYFIRETYDDNKDYIDEHDNTLFIGAGNDSAGNMQGEMIYNYLTGDNSRYKIENGPDADHKTVVNFLMYRGNIGNPAADARTKNALAVARKMLADNGYDNVTLNSMVDSESGYEGYDAGWSGVNAGKHMATYLTNHEVGIPETGVDNGKINMLLTNSDAMVIAAIKEIVTKDSSYNKDKAILAIGMDAANDGREYIKNGLMAGTLEIDSDLDARLIAHAALKASEGKTGVGMAEDINTVAGAEEANIDIVVSTTGKGKVKKYVLFDAKVFEGNEKY